MIRKALKIGGITLLSITLIGGFLFSDAASLVVAKNEPITSSETDTSSKKQETINEDISESKEVICEEPVTDIVYTTTSLNVRENPNISSKRVGVLEKNSELIRVEDNDEWDAIEVAGVKYYVYDKYLTDTKPETIKKVTKISQPPAPKKQETQSKQNINSVSGGRYPLNVSISEEDKLTLAALVWLEGRGEPIECQQAIASVVFNRMMVHKQSLNSVVYAKNQFTPAQYISSTIANKDISKQKEIVNDLCINGTTIPIHVLYFRSSYYFNWSTVSDYAVYGNTYFSSLKSLM